MQDKIARQVHQVFGYGLEAEGTARGGERPHFEAEQTKLRGLLLGDSEIRYIAEYAGEGASQTGSSIRTSQGALRGAEPFLGIRYALACWLDEVFIADSPWSQQWTESMMEVALYGGSSLRAVRFWEQAKRPRPGPGPTDWKFSSGAWRSDSAASRGGRDQSAAMGRGRPQASPERICPGIWPATREGPANICSGTARAGAVRHHAPGGGGRRRIGRLRGHFPVIQGPGCPVTEHRKP